LGNLNLFVAYSTLLLMFSALQGAFGAPKTVAPGINSKVFDLLFVGGIAALAWAWRKYGLVPKEPRQPIRYLRGQKVVAVGNLICCGSAALLAVATWQDPQAGAVLPWFLPLGLGPGLLLVCIGLVLVETGR
jgi:hypothetical protein